jgi:RimJ/RimL family protein N-acetyltransferase
MNYASGNGEAMEISREIRTRRLIIRPCSQESADAISKSNGDDNVTKYLSSLSDEQIAIIFKDKAQVELLLKRISASRGDGNSLLYGAWLDQKMIGYIALVNCAAKIPDLQIEMAPDYQGKGYGYEFLKTVLRYVFKKHGYDAIRYTVLPSNDASIALVKKVGAFLQEPASEAERILIKTYLVSSLSMDARDAHRFCTNNKPQLEKDSICGCFCCEKIFDPAEIDNWYIYDNPCDCLGTAFCPYCEIDSVIGESSGYPITAEFMAAMNKIWFGEN